MGFHCTWVAIQGLAPDKVLKILGLKQTGKFDECPDADYTGLRCNDWFIVFSNVAYHPWSFPAIENEKIQRKLSCLGSVVSCTVAESTMISYSVGWTHGDCKWSVLHQSEPDIYHLDVTGEPPSIFHEIEAEFRSLQDMEEQSKRDITVLPVDYMFEIPVELCARMTGFRHDRVLPELGDRPYETLEHRLGIRRLGFLLEYRVMRQYGAYTKYGRPPKKKWWELYP